MPRLVIGVNGKGHELSQQLLQSCYIALSYGVGHSPSLIPTCFAFPLTPGYKALILSHTLAFSEFLRILSQTNHPTLQESSTRRSYLTSSKRASHSFFTASQQGPPSQDTLVEESAGPRAYSSFSGGNVENPTVSERNVRILSGLVRGLGGLHM